VKSGIYHIKNLVNGKAYIGSSKDIPRRLRDHRSTLKSSERVHENIYLQRSWDKYGANNFVFEPIENVPVEQLVELEQKYLDRHKNAGDWKHLYNINPIAAHPPILKGEDNPNYGGLSPETRKKLSDAWTDERKAAHAIEFSGDKNPFYRKTDEDHPAFGISRTEDTRQRIKNTWTKKRKEKHAKMMSCNNPMKDPTKQFSDAERKAAVKDYLSSDLTQAQIGKRYGVSQACIGKWVKKFKAIITI